MPRFYFGTGVAAAISPAVDATYWERDIPGFARYKLSTVRDNSALADVSSLFGSTSTSDTCWAQFIGDPMPPQTISGSFDSLIRCQELSATEDAYLSYSIRALSNDGTVVRGILGQTNNTTREMNVAVPTTRGVIPTPFTLTPTATLQDDRLCVEVGVHGITPDNLVNIILRFGAPNGTAEFVPPDGAGTDLVPWIDFTHDVFATGLGLTLQRGGTLT